MRARAAESVAPLLLLTCQISPRFRRNDYERGLTPPTQGRPDHHDQGLPRNNSKLTALLGVDPSASRGGGGVGGGGGHDVMSDLRDIGYLPSSSTGSSPSSSRIRPDGARGGPASPRSGPSMQSLPSASSMPHSTSSSNNDVSAASLDADCPVCLEPLSYRLAGEKPHVVPNCGHALHNACFTAVYGRPEAVLASQDGGSSPPGMCGVCRRAIVLGGDVEGSSSKGSSEYMRGACTVLMRGQGTRVVRRGQGRGRASEGREGHEPQSAAAQPSHWRRVRRRSWPSRNDAERAHPSIVPPHIIIVCCS